MQEKIKSVECSFLSRVFVNMHAARTLHARLGVGSVHGTMPLGPGPGLLGARVGLLVP